MKKPVYYKVIDRSGINMIYQFEYNLPRKDKLGRNIPGKWHVYEGEIKICSSGFHMTTRPSRHLRWDMKPPVVFVAETRDETIPSEQILADKIVVRTMRLKRELSKEETISLGVYPEGVSRLCFDLIERYMINNDNESEYYKFKHLIEKVSKTKDDESEVTRLFMTVDWLYRIMIARVIEFVDGLTGRGFCIPDILEELKNHSEVTNEESLESIYKITNSLSSKVRAYGYCDISRPLLDSGLSAASYATRDAKCRPTIKTIPRADVIDVIIGYIEIVAFRSTRDTVSAIEEFANEVMGDYIKLLERLVEVR